MKPILKSVDYMYFQVNYFCKVRGTHCFVLYLFCFNVLLYITSTKIL